MHDTTKLIAALESIAYDEDERDRLHSLDVIRGMLAPDTTSPIPDRRAKGDWTIKSAAHGLLSEAARLARARKGKRAIQRVAASYMGQHPVRGQPQERDLECAFAVRAVWKKGRPLLEIVGPLNARPRFLIGYAFWIAAKSLRVSVWLRSKRKRCAECGKMFSDIATTGRPRTYCSRDCYSIGHARKDKRRRRT